MIVPQKGFWFALRRDKSWADEKENLFDWQEFLYDDDYDDEEHQVARSNETEMAVVSSQKGVIPVGGDSSTPHVREPTSSKYTVTFEDNSPTPHTSPHASTPNAMATSEFGKDAS